MSIKPPIKCPPDYSILAFRFTECKKAGIVKGVTTQLAVDLQDMFVPVTSYEERSLTLKAGQTKRIDPTSLGITWPLQETFEFNYNPAYTGLGTSHTYTLYDEDLVLIESFTFTVINNFATDLNTALLATVKIKTLVTMVVSPTVPGLLTIKAVNRGIKYRHVFAFDINGFGGYFPFPYLHPGNLTVPYQKYDRERLKIIMIYPDFYKSNVLANCSCLDPSGDLKSNKKYIEYAYDDDVFRINNPGTPITATPIVPPTPPTDPIGMQWTWDQSSTDHLGYHIQNGDLISSALNPTLRGIVSNIEGYYFETDAVIGGISSSQSLTHVWSPNSVTWRKMGDFYLHTTGQEIDDADRIFIETLWLRNPHQYDLPIKLILAS